jgi:tetratricopeptide (TPR) repeat protein
MESRSHQIYLRYFGIGDDAWREKVRFYEENAQNLDSMYFDDRIELDMDYLLCLFEVGRYERFLSKTNPVLETIIAENIFTFKGVNIFNELLFRKAACYFQLKQFDKAKNILRQLISLDASNGVYIGLYTICNRKLNNDIYLSIKATAMAAFLIVLGITIARIFLEPFFDIYLQPFIMLRSILLVYAIACLIGLEMAFQYKIKHETNMYSFWLLNRIFGRKV